MTDQARIERLTELAQRVWPDIHVDVDTSATPCSTEGRRLGAWVQQYFPRPVGPVESGPVLLSVPEHPRALDALEAALLVLAGDDPSPASLAEIPELSPDALSLGRGVVGRKLASMLPKDWRPTQAQCDAAQLALTGQVPAWVDELASEFEREAEQPYHPEKRHALKHCAAELRERAKP